MQTECIGGLSEKKWGGQYHQQDRVYSMGDIALAHKGEEQHLEPRKDNLTNTITTVEKDNICMEIHLTSETKQTASLSRAEQSRAEQSRAEQSRAVLFMFDKRLKAA